MTRDRVTLTRAEAIRRRKDEETKHRETHTQKLVRKPRPAATPKRTASHSTNLSSPGRLRRRYDIALSHPQGRGGYNRNAQAPALPSISLPQVEFGPRWFSAVLAAASVILLYFMWTSDPFLVRTANIYGNTRIGALEIQSALGILNHPAALLNPEQIEYNLRYTFPEVDSVSVNIRLPAEVSVTIHERQPVVAWMQDGQVQWLDASGYAFPPRGEIEGLTTINAAGAPPALPDTDVTQTIGARPFVTTDMASAILMLAPHLPADASLIYDPQYGLGWTDPRGWQAYFGGSQGDMPVKLKVYESLVESLQQEGIQPSLISVAYPDAPFYRVEQ